MGKSTKPKSTAKKPAAKKSKPAPAQNGFSFISVKIGKLPGKIHDIALNGGRKVSDAIEGAEIAGCEGFEVRVNGMIGSVDSILKNNDIVLLIKKIKGN